MVAADEVLDFQIGPVFGMQPLVDGGLVAALDGAIDFGTGGSEAGAAEEMGGADGLGVGEGDLAGSQLWVVGQCHFAFLCNRALASRR